MFSHTRLNFYPTYEVIEIIICLHDNTHKSLVLVNFWTSYNNCDYNVVLPDPLANKSASVINRGTPFWVGLSLAVGSTHTRWQVWPSLCHKALGDILYEHFGSSDNLMLGINDTCCDRWYKTNDYLFIYFCKLSDVIVNIFPPCVFPCTKTCHIPAGPYVCVSNIQLKRKWWSDSIMLSLIWPRERTPNIN